MKVIKIVTVDKSFQSSEPLFPICKMGILTNLVLNLQRVDMWFDAAASIILLFFPFIFISWRLIILQYCSGFCHTLT